MNGCRSRPSRVCRNRAGPGVVSRMSTTTAASSGDNTSRQADATTRSKIRLPRSEDRPRRARRGDAAVNLIRASAKAGLRHRQRVAHGLADQVHLTFTHVREYRQREDFTGGAFGDRKRVGSETPVGRLPVTRDGVVDLGLDPRCRQLTLDVRAIWHLGNSEVVGAEGARLLRHQAGRPVAEGRAVPGGYRPTRFGPRVEPGKLDGQHQSLQGVKTTIGPDFLVLVPGIPSAAVVAEAPDPVGQHSVRCNNGPGVTEGAQVLCRIEAEATRASDGSGPPTAPARPV